MLNLVTTLRGKQSLLNFDIDRDLLNPSQDV